MWRRKRRRGRERERERERERGRGGEEEEEEEGPLVCWCNVDAPCTSHPLHVRNAAAGEQGQRSPLSLPSHHTHHVCHCADDEAGFIEKSEHSGVLHLHQVTDDLVIEVVDLRQGVEESQQPVISHHSTSCHIKYPLHEVM